MPPALAAYPSMYGDGQFGAVPCLVDGSLFLAQSYFYVLQFPTKRIMSVLPRGSVGEGCREPRDKLYVPVASFDGPT